MMGATTNGLWVMVNPPVSTTQDPEIYGEVVGLEGLEPSTKGL